jgi:hypothetical protein
LTAPSIVSIYPASGAISAPVSCQVSIIFDREIDETRLEDGGFVLTGPDDIYYTGPHLDVDFDDPTTGEDDAILTSPGYIGFAEGTYTFQRVDSEGSVLSGAYDYSGLGTLYRTKVLFTPSKPLYPNTEYTVYLTGDDDALDDRKAGITTRTVFDPQKGFTSGTGMISARGGYTGTISDRFVFTVVTGGAPGVAVARWYKESDPVLTYVLSTSSGYMSVADGLEVKFNSGNYVVDDTFYVTVAPPETMDSTYTWSFTTGSGSITDVPDSASSSVISTTPASTVFQVSSTSPANRKSNLPLKDCRIITVTFNNSIDEDTINDETLKVFGLPVNGIEDGSISYRGELVKKYVVSGNILTIYI